MSAEGRTRIKAGVDARPGLRWRNRHATAGAVQDHDEQPDHERFASAYQRDAHVPQQCQRGDEASRGQPPEGNGRIKEVAAQEAVTEEQGVEDDQRQDG